MKALKTFLLLITLLWSLLGWGAPQNAILHFSDFGPPEITSGSATVMRLLQKSQTAAGKRVFLVLPEYDRDAYPGYADDAPVIRIPTGRSFEKSEGYRQLTAMFAAGEIEMVHVHKEGVFSRLGLSLAKHFGVPSVLTAHMMIGPFLEDRFSGKPWLLRKAAIDPIAATIESGYMKFANGFDAVLAPSSIVKDYLEGEGVTRPVLVVPPGGVPVERFTPIPNRAFLKSLPDFLSEDRNTLQDIAEGRAQGCRTGELLTSTTKIVLMIARLSTEKGVESVLSAWDRVRESSAFDFHLVLAGLGAVNGDSERIFAKMKLHPEAARSIHYVGSLPYDSIPELMSGADVLVNASHHETFGLALIEAGAAGKPVIAPALPAFQTFLKDGEHALFVPEINGENLSATLEKLFANPALVERMGTAARANAELYSSESVSARTFNAYQAAKVENTRRFLNDKLKEGHYFKTPLSAPQMCQWLLGNWIVRRK